MSNPLLILETLDRHLSGPAELTIFGRAALALGFPGAPAAFESTRDVDGILPSNWLAAKDENIDFWLAQQKTNAELETQGLYITHLFRETEIILSPDWLGHRVPLALSLKKLNVLRPATIDLVLSKMMRGDEDDLADIKFLLSRGPFTPGQLQAAFAGARVPDVPEIEELFRATQPKVLALAQQLSDATQK